VRADAEFELLINHLLGNTWLVRDLADAFLIAREAPECRFITRAGEVLEADGTVSIGRAQAPGGLLSRKSELRRLRDDTGRLDGEIQLSQSRIGDVDREISDCEAACSGAEQHIAELAEQLAEFRSLMAARRQELDEIAEEARVLTSEIAQLDADSAQIQQRREAAEVELQRVDADLAQRRESIREAEGNLAEAEERRQDWQRRVTAAKVEWATGEKEVESLGQQFERQEERWQQHRRALDDAHAQWIEGSGRLRQTTLETLRHESAVAGLFLEKDRLEVAHRGLLRQRERLRAERQSLQERSQQRRGAIRHLEDQLRRAQLEASELRHERNHLTERLREDYEIELAELAEQPTTPAELPSLVEDGEERLTLDFDHTPRTEIEGEIEKLRRKIAAMGNVNLDALRELDELEGRFEVLSRQRDDLVHSKEDLEEIICKLNADSRRLFSDTLETIRGHFQELFRKLFGGGRADIVLEDEGDILESGIDIVARPPGKEPRRLSLLSGGEKTLTAVALLLAIFRSRPSPFCVLDEVDAALDEANIDRFIEVIREFLAWTQFIVVTHSKRTMTCAGVLYGVTMQESGVSKRVAVRFEDVREDGSFKSAQAGAEPPQPLLEQSDSGDHEQAA
jgi:chromosome segregation protein